MKKTIGELLFAVGVIIFITAPFAVSHIGHTEILNTGFLSWGTVYVIFRHLLGLLVASIFLIPGYILMEDELEDTPENKS